MKSILISIRPEWCDLIFKGTKDFELRKTFPKDLKLPFKVYVYETFSSQGSGVVIGEFVVDKIFKIQYDDINKCYCLEIGAGAGNNFYYGLSWHIIKGTCLSDKQFRDYLNGGTGYAWHISEPLLYNDPKQLSYFALKRPPQSWCYAEETYNENFFRNEMRDFCLETFSNSYEHADERPQEPLLLHVDIEYFYNKFKDRVNGYSDRKYSTDNYTATFEKTCEKKLFDVISELYHTQSTINIEKTHTQINGKWVKDSPAKSFIKYLVKIGNLPKEIEKYDFYGE